MQFILSLFVLLGLLNVYLVRGAPTTYLTISVYADAQCKATVMKQTIQGLNICIKKYAQVNGVWQPSGASQQQKIGFNNVDGTKATIYTYSYTDGSCTTSETESMQQSYEINVCSQFTAESWILVSYSASDLLPYVGAYGVRFKYYQSESTCKSGDTATMEYTYQNNVCIPDFIGQKSMRYSCSAGGYTTSQFSDDKCQNMVSSITQPIQNRCLFNTYAIKSDVQAYETIECAPMLQPTGYTIKTTYAGASCQGTPLMTGFDGVGMCYQNLKVSTSGTNILSNDTVSGSTRVIYTPPSVGNTGIKTAQLYSDGRCTKILDSSLQPKPQQIQLNTCISHTNTSSSSIVSYWDISLKTSQPVPVGLSEGVQVTFFPSNEACLLNNGFSSMNTYTPGACLPKGDTKSQQFIFNSHTNAITVKIYSGIQCKTLLSSTDLLSSTCINDNNVFYSVNYYAVPIPPPPLPPIPESKSTKMTPQAKALVATSVVIGILIIFIICLIWDRYRKSNAKTPMAMKDGLSMDLPSKVI